MPPVVAPLSYTDTERECIQCDKTSDNTHTFCYSFFGVWGGKQVDLKSVMAKLKFDLDEAESAGAAALPKAVAEQVLFLSVVYV